MNEIQDKKPADNLPKTKSAADVLKTRDAKKVYKDILELIKKYPSTREAKNRIDLIFPSTDPKAIKNQVSRIEKARKINDKEILSLLERIGELKKPKPFYASDRVAATQDEGLHTKLVESLGNYLPVELISEPKDLEAYKECAVFVFPDGDMTAEDYDSIQFDITDVVPEVELGRFIVNRDTINALKEISGKIRGYDGMEEFFMNYEMLDRIVADLSVLDGSSNIAPGTDAEIDGMKNLIANFEKDIADASERINKEILGRVDKDPSLSLSGSQLLDAVRKIKESPDVDTAAVFPRIQKIIDAVIGEEEKKMASAYGWGISKFVDIFSPTYPSKFDEEIVQRVISDARRELAAKEIEIKKKTAKKMKGKWEIIEDALKKAFELDLFLALGRFACDFDLRAPVFCDHISFKNGRNLFFGNPQPISYALGSGEHKERIVVLTGANSGGKTTLINTIAQIQILGQMGLPVPAEECHLPLLQSVYYIGKYKGVMNAGAFEEMLNTIVPVIASEKDKIILVDELESVTEPGAAADIIATILKNLARSDALAVFITHLYEDILPKISGEKRIRVDGIEAKGLDNNLELIVDRQPKFGIPGKSTPELIVRRLYMRADKKTKGIYEEMLAEMGK